MLLILKLLKLFRIRILTGEAIKDKPPALERFLVALRKNSMVSKVNLLTHKFNLEWLNSPVA
jgi:hypothetical protein